EKEPEYAEFIRSHSQKGGFGSVVEVINADANDYLTTYNPGAGFDLIFVDADKSSYINYMRHAERLLRPGGIFAADNCLGFGELFDRNPSRGEKTIRTIREFNNALRNNSVFTSTIVPLGDGIALGVKV
ncbi:MAG: O-methyltransferase, partial [Bacteroidota bacterium]